MMRSPYQRKQAFTLIEILVVIAVMAILAAILFPVFSRAREAGRRTGCASNLHQIGLAVTQYKNDNGNSMPFWNYTATGYTHSDSASNVYTTNNYTWIDAIWSYAKNGQIFTCPSYPNAGKKFDQNSPSWTDVNSTASSYLFQQIGLNYWDNGALVNGAAYVTLTNPAETIYACGDSTSADCAGSTWGMGQHVDMRHNGTANFLFYDWHVKALMVSETSQGPYNQPNYIGQDGNDYGSTGTTAWSYWDNGTKP